ncbi:CLC_0170 family protein [Clostridium sp. MB40-C1]|uniref:CLC_0170 family protein n=1 Tax=Clostridium sp. MB40-C1 TaxID=3070996 RepID=UPI0027DFB928|nr:CLC_0170 family protein [Clostridium sp. MB40-C1]WMJ79705.1 CLC_0170 family protein [Clostridium sp. MB40-C1]
MKILDLFGKYFLALILIQGSILIFFDARNFKKGNLNGLYKKARGIGIGWIVIAILLFSIKMII